MKNKSPSRIIARPALLLSAAVLICSCATTEKASAEEDAVPAGGDSYAEALQNATPYDRSLLEIVKDQDKVFADLASGAISKDDYQRKIVNLSFRYDELISRNPNDVNTLVLYGKFLRQIGQTEQANTMFVHADRLAPNTAVIKQQLGNYMAEQGNYAEAMAYYLDAINLEPKEPIYHFGLGELLATFGPKLVEAGALTDDQLDEQMLAAFAKAAELDPANKVFAFRHGEAYYDLKTPRWNEALDVWTTVDGRTDLTQDEKDAVRLHRARIYCELYEDNKALELLRDDVAPLLRATRTRILKQINEGRSLKEDQDHAEVFAPSADKQASADQTDAGKAQDGAASGADSK